MDGETAETLAGVVRLLGRAGDLAWVRAESEGPRSPRQLVALGIDLVGGGGAAPAAHGVDVDGPIPVGHGWGCCGRLSNCCAPSPVCRSRGMRLGWRCGWPGWCGRRTPVPAADRRTPAELLAENDELARQLLLDVNDQRSPAMLRAFPAVVEAAARVWSTLPRTSETGSAGVDPMFRLVAVARGIDRAQTAGLWPGDRPGR